MDFVWFSVLLLLSVSSVRPNRIVGGELTTIEKYPGVVQVDFMNPNTNAWNQNCAASILNSNYVVSAANCFVGLFYEPQWRRFRAGSTFRNIGGIISYVERVFNHPTYGRIINDGDISVIKLSTALVYSPVIQQTTIVEQDSVIPDNLPVVHVGWGHTQHNGAFSSILRDVQIYTVNNKLCTDRYAQLGPKVTNNMICAGLLDVGGRDACDGDSGGPLYFGDVLIGIVSWGYVCGNDTYPGVSTNVASYTDWIVSIAV